MAELEEHAAGAAGLEDRVSELEEELATAAEAVEACADASYAERLLTLCPPAGCPRRKKLEELLHELKPARKLAKKAHKALKKLNDSSDESSDED
eukprot:COSAG01_NODE_3018_length_6713_cov_20.002570_6_plen_95_part_00